MVCEYAGHIFVNADMEMTSRMIRHKEPEELVVGDVFALHASHGMREGEQIGVATIDSFDADGNFVTTAQLVEDDEDTSAGTLDTSTPEEEA